MREILELVLRALTLKDLPRRGWKLVGVPNSEDVASHTFGVALLAMLVAKERGLDQEKAMKIALIHELGETVLGDITPRDEFPHESKSAIEEEEVEKILSKLPNGSELFELWKDFEYRRTPEGALVKDLDRFEMGLQASLYMERTGIDLREFLKTADRDIEDEELRSILREL